MLCSNSIVAQTVSTTSDSARAGLPRTEQTAKMQQKKIVRLYADINWTFSIAATDFFKSYQSLLRSPSPGFDAPAGLSVGMASYQVHNAPIGLHVTYARAVVRESYTYSKSPLDTAGLPTQNYSQNITMTTVPIVLTWDYYPIDRQFTGYIGGGIGAAAIQFHWREDISESQAPGARQSGVRYDAWHVAPAILARAGVSLGFDEPLGAKTKAGVYFEGSYSFMPFSAPLFAEAAKTLPDAPAATSGDYYTQAGGFQLRLGFNVFFMGK